MKFAGLVVLSGALLLAACGSPYAGSTLGQQVKNWATTSPDPKFADAVSTLQSDLHNEAQAQKTGDEALLRTTCDVIVTDALLANQNLPTPDTQLTNLLSSAYGSAVSAGQDCYCAAGGHPCRRGASSAAAFLARAARESSASERALIESQARVDQVSLSAGPGA